LQIWREACKQKRVPAIEFWLTGLESQDIVTVSVSQVATGDVSERGLK
jgi:hypothetical protein